MSKAADFRAQARKALKGMWLKAAGTGFVASLMGAEIVNLYNGGSGAATGGGSASGEKFLESAELANFVQSEEFIAVAAITIMLIATISMFFIAILLIRRKQSLQTSSHSLAECGRAYV